MAELPFVAENHLFWQSAPANVVVGAWRGPLQIPSMGDPWHSSDDGLTAFTGYLWPKGSMWREQSTWASQLEAFWRQHPFNSTVQDLDGLYTRCLCPRRALVP